MKKWQRYIKFHCVCRSINFTVLQIKEKEEKKFGENKTELIILLVYSEIRSIKSGKPWQNSARKEKATECITNFI